MVNLRILSNTYTTPLTTKKVAREVLFPPFLIKHIPLSKIEMALEKKMLKENGYQESIISKVFKRITNNHSLSESLQKTQSTDIQGEGIRTFMMFPNVEGAREKLQRVLKSHKIRLTFHTESTLRKFLCELTDRVTTENEKNVVYENDCSNCKAVYFDESKRSLKLRSDEHKRFAKSCDCDKNEL